MEYRRDIAASWQKPRAKPGGTFARRSSCFKEAKRHRTQKHAGPVMLPMQELFPEEEGRNRASESGSGVTQFQVAGCRNIE